MRKTGLYKVIKIFAFWLSSPLVLLATFSVLLLRGEQINAEKAFTTIMLFNILQSPISELPNAIAKLIQIWASLRRIGRFLYEPEIDRTYISHETHFDNAIEIRRGSFCWDL
jgi:ATP-binding cassette subfamily C (CFTR/MRP) protein 2